MSDQQHIHFIGIGGIGISGLARLYLHQGWQVSGTNDQDSPETLDALRKAGVIISLDRTELPEADMYVYSDAWLTLDPAIIERARATGKPTMSYFEAVAHIANEYYLIAVAGTHGKTTTTAMLIDILEEASYDPTAIVGSLRAKTGTNFRSGKSKYFIVEADEFRQHFLYFQPDVLVITNLEHDHVDCYPDLAAVQYVFRELAMKVPSDGAVVANMNDQNLTPVVTGLSCRVVDYRPDISLTLRLRQPGIHNRQNAAAATAAARFLGIEAGVTATALENFAGTWRRFQYKGDCNGAHIYDDYAHHPSEINATIAGARELYPNKKLTVVFQSHTYTRTKELFNDFVTVLGKADRVILVPIYAARETDTLGVSGEQLADALKQQGTDTHFFHTLDASALAVKESVGSDDVVVVMGAGDVTKVADQLVTPVAAGGGM